ncbi:MAG: hypothetical protein ACK5OX_14395 [Desertimonas sp.]
MSVSAWLLEHAASQLGTLRDGLSTRADDFDRAVRAGGSGMDLIEQSWRGPLPDTIDGQVRAYLTAVAAAPGAVASARDTIGRWATAATEAAGRLRTYESSLAGLEGQFATGVIDAASAERWTAVRSSIDQEDEGWRSTCQNKAAELQTAIETLQRCALAQMGTAEQRAQLLGGGYYVALAGWATMTGTDFDYLDTTGGLSAEAERRMSEFTDDEHADLMFAVIETMDQADIDKTDGHASGDDWALASDVDAVRFRLQIAAELAGVDLTDDQLDAMTAEIAVLALFGQGAPGGARDAVNDSFDEHGAIKTAVDAGGDTERDWELPDHPTETDEYIEEWLDAEWNNDPGFFDYVGMVVLPDFEVMNPWSDEFSPGWAIVEVIGIIPWGKVTKLARLGRLASFSDEVADVTNLVDEGADILSGSGRLADDALGGLDDVGRVGDDLVGGVDDVARVGDDAAGGVDDLARRPRVDPLVTSRSDEIGTQLGTDLQPRIDEFWADARQALGPDASPQQLGTYTHTQLDHYIQDHATQLIDPSTGYRVRSEVSFGETLLDDGSTAYGQVPRCTAGSIRPDVIVERRMVNAEGDDAWEVVGVSDLKTGNARITTSWRGRVETMVGDVPVDTLRPGQAVPR